MAHSTIISLDSTQQVAATSPAVLQLTLAGPGSGKTTTLAARYRHLVESGINPRRILAVTFTRKAAETMRQRIGALLGLDPSVKLPIMTFHAFAYRHLRNRPAAAGLPEGFQLWGPLQQRHVFHSRQMWWNEETDILDIIDGMKERLVDAAGFARMIEKEGKRLPDYYSEARRFFELYETSLRQAGAIDFADMIPMLDRAMVRDRAFRKMVTGAFDHLLVDEFQDTNPGQINLVSRFTEDGVHLWAVGDDDQTLFTFRASDIRHILDFEQKHQGAQVHLLTRNYRSAPEIVALAGRLIDNNKRRRPKVIQAIRAQPGQVVLRGYSTPDAEARQVSAALAQLLSQGYAPQQLAVLYRAGALGLGLQTALKERGIPFEVRGSGDLWQSVSARLVVGALHYLCDGGTVEAVSRLGTGRRAKILVERLGEIRGRGIPSFSDACQHATKAVATALPGSAPKRERNEWGTIVDAVGQLAMDCASLKELERRITEQSAILRQPSAHAVILSTVHSAKGLEWEAVFVIGLEEGVLPNGNAEDLEEERRVAYVAITRAKQIVGLTYAARRYGKSVSPSRFLAEIKGAPKLQSSGPRALGADEKLPLIEDRPGKFLFRRRKRQEKP